MASFSERYGYKPVREVMQVESMDEDLRNSLWNAVNIYFWPNPPQSLFRGNEATEVVRDLWIYHFKRTIDSLPARWEGHYQVAYHLRTFFSNVRIILRKFPTVCALGADYVDGKTN